MADAVVRAAGGVVWREAQGGVEVLVIHRPRYDDWSLPKGKLDGDESEAAAAIREVEEETGLRCVLGEELPGSRYVDSRGRPKTVRYWLMQVEHSEPREPDDEVDECVWLPPAAARDRLSYARDVEVLDAASDVLTTR